MNEFARQKKSNGRAENNLLDERDEKLDQVRMDIKRLRMTDESRMTDDGF